MVATGAQPVTECASDFGDFTLAVAVPTEDGVPAGIGPRRSALDAVLVQAVVAAGAELHERATVAALVQDGVRVRGARVRTLKGGAA